MSHAKQASADMSTWNARANHEITFYEEEISNVSLRTLYAFDGENVRAKSTCGTAVWCLRRRRRLRPRLQPPIKKKPRPLETGAYILVTT
jgi:hypothetical protein